MQISSAYLTKRCIDAFTMMSTSLKFLTQKGVGVIHVCELWLSSAVVVTVHLTLPGGFEVPCDPQNSLAQWD